MNEFCVNFSLEFEFFIFLKYLFIYCGDDDYFLPHTMLILFNDEELSCFYIILSSLDNSR